MVDTAEEINRLKVILMNPNTFTIAAAEAVERAATAANAAITYTEEMTHARVCEAVDRSGPVLTMDLRCLGDVDNTDDEDVWDVTQFVTKKTLKD